MAWIPTVRLTVYLWSTTGYTQRKECYRFSPSFVWTLATHGPTPSLLSGIYHWPSSIFIFSPLEYESCVGRIRIIIGNTTLLQSRWRIGSIQLLCSRPATWCRKQYSFVWCRRYVGLPLSITKTYSRTVYPFCNKAGRGQTWFCNAPEIFSILITRAGTILKFLCLMSITEVPLDWPLDQEPGCPACTHCTLILKIGKESGTI